jgi:23S rRNA-/tRNA-specific pseudouridylate synthase
LHPTSRLDAEVTGLVTFARTKEAIAALREARKKGRYGRGYIALALGVPAAEEGEWEKSIAIDPRDPRSRVALPMGGSGNRAQTARTVYQVRARVTAASALWLTPHTGRTHQLRVHAADAGLPLLGDARYGGPKRVVLDDGRVVTARRTMLHCAWLRIPSVRGTELLSLHAEVPDDFAKVWRALGGEEAALEASP